MNKFLQGLFDYITLPKGLMLRATVYSCLNKVCDIVPEILIGLSIDIIVNQRNSLVAKMGISDPYYQLYAVGGITALFWIFESLFEYWYSQAWRMLAQQVQHDVRLKIYDTLQRLDMAYFERTTTGGLITVIQDDTNQLEEFFAQTPNDILQLVVNIVVMGAIFFYLSPVLALVALLPIPAVVGIAYYFKYSMGKAYDSLREQSASLAGHVGYRVQGVATIKSYVTQQYELGLLEQKSGRLLDVAMVAHRVHALYIPTVRMAVMVGFIGSLVLGGVYAMQGVIPINWYAALVFLTQRFLWPFTTLTAITDRYERALASAKRIVGVLSAQPSIKSGTRALPGDQLQGEITLNNVSFGYNPGEPILNALSVSIPAGKTVAFVGPTGSGKSTVVKLLTRFYDASAGAITIDGADIATLDIDDLRRAIGLVSQDAYMVEGTVAENITYGSFGATRDEIIEAARMAQAHDFIMRLPQGYDTVLHEHGKNISGGQRQRISIARALLKRAKILIFDEATSAVDNDTEHAIQQSLAHLAAHHTIIIIAHRLATVRKADVIVVLDKGVIVESGNHDELVAHNGVYARLWGKQG